MHLKPLLLLTSLLGSLPGPSLASSSPSSSSSTTTITVRLPSAHPLLPNPNALPASTRATLTTLGRNRAAAPLSTASTFVFRNVSRGSYLLDVHCPTHFFAPLRVDVVAPEEEEEEDGLEGGKEKKGGRRLRVQAWETFRGNDWGNKGEVVPVLEGDVLEARVVGGKGYFMERSRFSVLSIFKNPIILLSLVSMGLFFGMPKLIENMDPEMRAEWEERQKENPMNALMGAAASGQNPNPMGNFDMAAFLAGSSSKVDENKGKGENRKKR
ncbi:hypothetical protein VTK26DRAFT_1882 [Humicola hyalothermophila]